MCRMGSNSKANTINTPAPMRMVVRRAFCFFTSHQASATGTAMPVRAQIPIEIIELTGTILGKYTQFAPILTSPPSDDCRYRPKIWQTTVKIGHF